MTYIIIRGPMGSGKSTISKALATRLKGLYIGIDDIVDKHGLSEDKEEGYISQKSFIKANEIAVKEARETLESGLPVVFDGNFYWKSQAEDLVDRLGSDGQVFTLKIPLEICIKRDRARSQSYGVDAVKVVYAKTTEFECGEVIDASKPVKNILEEISPRLSNL